MMTKTIMACVFLLALTPVAFGQKATEQYIPIGKSPGLIAPILYNGAIRDTDETAHTLTFSDSGGTHVVRVTKNTKIWLDRSASRRINRVASYRDCKVGRVVELKFVDPDKREVAEWIKIRTD